MEFLNVNSKNGHLNAAKDPEADFVAILYETLRKLPANAPITIMIHGCNFTPFNPLHSPHTTLFSKTGLSKAARATRRNAWKIRSWPRHLGYSDPDQPDGLCIGFAWDGAKHTKTLIPSIRETYERAGKEGRFLATIINWIARRRPEAKVDLMAHSMGGRVALQALPHVHSANVGRVILMGATECRQQARIALKTKAGSAAEFYNITSRENDLFDWMFETSVKHGGRHNPAIGTGLGCMVSNWVNIQIDDLNTLKILKNQDISIEPSHKRLCHWAFYIRPGIFDLYRAILHRHPDTSVTALQSKLAEVTPAPRWSRFPISLPNLPSFGTTQKGREA